MINLNIQNNTIVICENNYKKYILENTNTFLNVIFYNKKEFLNQYLFYYNEETIYYLTQKYHLKKDICLMYLDNLKYIDNNKIYQNKKLKFLQELKRELDNNNLLFKGLLNDEYLHKFKLIVIGYNYLDNFELKIFKKLQAEIIREKELNYSPLLYEFKTIEEEVSFVAKEISKLIDKGININKIKLVNVDKYYYNTLKRIFNFYNIPIKIPSSNTLYNNYIGQKFLQNYNSDIKISLNKIIKDNQDIVNKIINICNKYSFINDYLKVKDLIIDEFKNTIIDNFELKNYIELTDLFYPYDQEYVFLMNFNMESIPSIIKDEDYLTDNLKYEIDLKTTTLINKEIKRETIKKIKSIKNLKITYKLSSYKETYYPSFLIQDLDLKLTNPIDDLISYSYLDSLLDYTKLLDKYYKYKELDNKIYLYNNTFPHILYNSYNNSYTLIDLNLLKQYLNNKLSLSYTSLNNYNLCPFKYYLANILLLDKDKETFNMFLGNLFHYVLEKCVNNKENINNEVNNFLNNQNKELTFKERFYINKIIKDIEFAINIINKQKDYTTFDSSLTEQKIIIEIGKREDININFVGYVDKILFKEDNHKTYISIIDYKTGLIDNTLKYMPYGLNMQLPIYLYLVSQSNLFINPVFVGFYLQYVMNKNIKNNLKKTYEKLKEDSLMLAGYSNSDKDILSLFDKTYINSFLIKGLKIKKDGNFYSNSKVLTDKEIDKVISLCKDNINNTITQILKADFKINPKKIGENKIDSCTNCKFKDICFKKEEDYNRLKERYNLNFLGSDNNELD